MKLTIGLIALTFCGVCFAEDADILSIRNEYQSIHKKLPELISETIYLPDYATEGADAIFYRDSEGHIDAIKVEYYWESGKDFAEFYYKNEQLIFVFYKTLSYNQHPGITPKIAEKQAVEPFDPKKTKVEEDRFYFVKNDMIRWLREEKWPHGKRDSIDANNAEFKRKARELIEKSNDLLSKARNIK